MLVWKKAVTPDSSVTINQTTIVLTQKPKIYIFLEIFKFNAPNLLAKQGAVSL